MPQISTEKLKLESLMDIQKLRVLCLPESVKKMYGLLLENLSEFIKAAYGEEAWEEIRRLASVEQPSFSIHQVYPEGLIPKLAKKAIEVLDITEKEFFDQMGVYFVGFVSQYGYDQVLSVLGRQLRDFLNGLDNLHEYLKFSYPRMKAPSFICENETEDGLTLHYRSKRRGFVFYTMGQIREVARHFYHKDMVIELLKEERIMDTTHVTFQLSFDNRVFSQTTVTLMREEKHLPINASVLFQIFPFCIVYGSDMVIRSIGTSLMQILPQLVGKKITDKFDLLRPLIPFIFQMILNRTNNIFEMITTEPVVPDRSRDRGEELMAQVDESDATVENNLHLKGQMIYMDDWKMILYLATPVMPDLNSLVSNGLFINDLSMHDFSRDLMLAGTQQSVELKLALDQEQQKSKKLEESMKKLDLEMKRTDELLYQMIPKQVADRLRTGENPIDTCEVFDEVSILFSDVVTFTEICSRISPMEVVSMLNAMYSIFDTLTERNSVYKVETIGDAYMVVAGAPDKDELHAQKVCDMALDMVEAITDLKDPSTGNHLRIRVGVHSGTVVAGIVGLKMPRYCLFGDSVNTASRMESTSEAMKIHISETTRAHLPTDYKVSQRGEIQVKGKGSMKTYWLESHALRAPLTRSAIPTPVYYKEKENSPQGNGATQAPHRHNDDTKLNAPNANRLGGDLSVEIPTSRASSSISIRSKSRGVYSPVTFQDVARHSVASSPVKTPPSSRESRSNSFECGRLLHHESEVKLLNEKISSLKTGSVETCEIITINTPNKKNQGKNSPRQRLVHSESADSAAALRLENQFQEIMPNNKIPVTTDGQNPLLGKGPTSINSIATNKMMNSMSESSISLQPRKLMEEGPQKTRLNSDDTGGGGGGGSCGPTPSANHQQCCSGFGTRNGVQSNTCELV